MRDMERANRIAANLKRVRQSAGIYQSDLARSAGMNKSMICMIESGKRSPGPNNLRRLAEALKCSEAELTQ